MAYWRAIASGLFVWSCVSLSFFLLGQISLIEDSFLAQAFIVMICISFYAFFGAQFYYKKGYKTNGFIIGIIMSGTALLLDACITVPFVEIPNRRSYQHFFTSAFLWILVLVTVFTDYLYWRNKIKLKKDARSVDLAYFFSPLKL